MKTLISTLEHTTRFWNNLHQVRFWNNLHQVRYWNNLHQVRTSFGSNKTKGTIKDSQNRLRSPMPKIGDISFINNYII